MQAQVNKKQEYLKSASFLHHVKNSKGKLVCSSKTARNADMLTRYAKDLVAFIAAYNDPETKHTCCQHCRYYIKTRQIDYRGKYNNLKGFRL